MGDATKLSVSTGYETADSDWGRFLSCWVDRYSQTGRAGDPENTIVFGHAVSSLLTPDLERVEGKFGFALPKSLRDFLAIYNPDADCIGLGHGLPSGSSSSTHIRQWFRMDWHKIHTRESYDWSVPGFHFHTRTARP